MDHRIRAYDGARDLDAVTRIWLEVGWLESDEKKPVLGAFLESAHAEVGEMNGEAECMVHWVQGSIQYQDTPLSLCAITAVTTSHIGRRLGFASAMTTRALEQAVASGCAVAALGMFEQGFYDRLGFGTGSYENDMMFDPAALLVDHVPYEPPVRLTVDDFADIHGAMMRRLPGHGSVNLDSQGLTEADIKFPSKTFGLGYRDDSGQLTHFVFGTMKTNHGPWVIHGMAYENTDQLLRLLRLLKELADQVRSVRLREPAHLQLQVLLKDPVRERDRSRTSPHQSEARSMAWWQFRILDLDACVAARNWVGPDVKFNLTLTDPLEARLGGDWRGVGGEYTIIVGSESSATAGHTEGLPGLSAGVGAFSRLWFGVRPATTLAVTDELEAPADLLASLDEALRLPKPLPGWDF